MNASETADTPTPRVTVNGEEERLPEEGASVATLLRALDVDPEQSGLAVAVDDHVVRQQDWGATALSGGERIELIAAQQGG
jgi:sulfur carrier protein